MGSDGICVHTEERDSDKSTVPPQPQNGVAKFECGVVFIGIPLVEVYICAKLNLRPVRHYLQTGHTKMPFSVGLSARTILRIIRGDILDLRLNDFPEVGGGGHNY